jgi:glycerate 2-kinase
MKIVIAPDSFKGSASSAEIAIWLETGIKSVIPECETVAIPIGDGGEGTLAALLRASFTAQSHLVTGPSGNSVIAEIAIKDQLAVVELAQASGLSQLLNDQLLPLTATSYGTGELIKIALDAGAEEIILAVGGSACTDAGAGALQALGGKLMKSDGTEIAYGGASLNDCASIDISQLDSRIAKTRFILASDVTNPLLGPTGAVAIYSPQKGARPADVALLEAGISHFAELVGGKNANTPGAGAAGGFGFMAYSFLNAHPVSGIDTVLKLVNFHERISGADLVITGEGKFDSQSLSGKAPLGVYQMASEQKIPVALVCGQIKLNSSAENSPVFDSLHALSSFEADINQCINNPRPIVEKIGAAIAKGLLS